MPNKFNLIYLLGAGRSGTTLLATLLNNLEKIETLGEMHQFYEFLEEGKNCSCGEKLQHCLVWKNIQAKLSLEEISRQRKLLDEAEKHGKIPKLLFGKSVNQPYLQIQEELFAQLQQQRKSEWFVDSSKYIARYLLLKKSNKINLKGIYVVRDPRGVVHSFRKNVQTSKSPLSALLYYNLINFFGEIVYRLDKGVLKIRYEDLVENPDVTLAKIYTHIFEEKTTDEVLPEYFKMPHIVGGNRMKAKEKIRIQPDKKWKSMVKSKQILYYMLSLPFVFINRNKIIQK